MAEAGVPRDVLYRLRRAHDLEVKARQEADALLRLAWELGATDRQIAFAMQVSFDTARMRRRRARLGRDDRMRGNHAPSRRAAA